MDSRILVKGPVLCVARARGPGTGPRPRPQRRGRCRCDGGHDEGPRPAEARPQPGQGWSTSAALSVAAAGAVAFVRRVCGPQPGSQLRPGHQGCHCRAEFVAKGSGRPVASPPAASGAAVAPLRPEVVVGGTGRALAAGGAGRAPRASSGRRRKAGSRDRGSAASRCARRGRAFAPEVIPEVVARGHRGVCGGPPHFCFGRSARGQLSLASSPTADQARPWRLPWRRLRS